MAFKLNPSNLQSRLDRFGANKVSTGLSDQETTSPKRHTANSADLIKPTIRTLRSNFENALNCQKGGTADFSQSTTHSSRVDKETPDPLLPATELSRSPIHRDKEVDQLPEKPSDEKPKPSIRSLRNAFENVLDSVQSPGFKGNTLPFTKPGKPSSVEVAASESKLASKEKSPTSGRQNDTKQTSDELLSSVKKLSAPGTELRVRFRPRPPTPKEQSPTANQASPSKVSAPTHSPTASTTSSLEARQNEETSKTSVAPPVPKKPLAAGSELDSRFNFVRLTQEEQPTAANQNSQQNVSASPHLSCAVTESTVPPVKRFQPSPQQIEVKQVPETLSSSIKNPPSAGNELRARLRPRPPTPKEQSPTANQVSPSKVSVPSHLPTATRTSSSETVPVQQNKGIGKPAGGLSSSRKPFKGEKEFNAPFRSTFAKDQISTRVAGSQSKVATSLQLFNATTISSLEKPQSSIQPHKEFNKTSEDIIKSQAAGTELRIRFRPLPATQKEQSPTTIHVSPSKVFSSLNATKGHQEAIAKDRSYDSISTATSTHVLSPVSRHEDSEHDLSSSATEQRKHDDDEGDLDEKQMVKQQSAKDTDAKEKRNPRLNRKISEVPKDAEVTSGSLSSNGDTQDKGASGSPPSKPFSMSNGGGAASNLMNEMRDKFHAQGRSVSPESEKVASPLPLLSRSLEDRNSIDEMGDTVAALPSDLMKDMSHVLPCVTRDRPRRTARLPSRYRHTNPSPGSPAPSASQLL